MRARQLRLRAGAVHRCRAHGGHRQGGRVPGVLRSAVVRSRGDHREVQRGEHHVRARGWGRVGPGGDARA